jgi:hypothetical protein
MPRKTKNKPGPEATKLANLRIEKKLYDDASEYARLRDETFSRFVRRLLRETIYAGTAQG